ncbi:MAG: hypothetical protein KGL39_54050 [Patescibacteria group bacterium]|nr:hypothetical protein [Patescibacteria group bacterium]
MWGVAFVAGKEIKVAEKLRGLGVECFCPEEWHFYLDKKSKKQLYRVRPLFPGYIFFRMVGLAEYRIVKASDEISRVLGWVSEDEVFHPSEIRAEEIEELRAAGPVKMGVHKSRKKGDRVKVLIGRLTEQIVQVERTDRSGRVLVGVEMLGKKHLVKLNAGEFVDA